MIIIASAAELSLVFRCYNNAATIRPNFNCVQDNPQYICNIYTKMFCSTLYVTTA